MRASRLLEQARSLYDDPELPFANLAQSQGWKDGFTSGADWMRCVLSHHRIAEIPTQQTHYQFFGIIKYGSASLGALLVIAFVLWTGWWILLPLTILAFYAIEAQMVFLFPLLIDGSTNPLHDSRQWTIRAGGTIPVMITVMQLALVMLFGGFVGQGFIRSWALGCLAVCLWYEELRYAQARLIR